jgi:CRP/FNR family putative post-exponential-phase nitrogen-starvation transcriptional regulator
MPVTLSKESISVKSLEPFFSEPEKILPYVSAKKYVAGELMLYNEPMIGRMYIFTKGRFNLYGIQNDGTSFLFRTCESVMLMGENELLIKHYHDLQKLAHTSMYYEMLTNCEAVIIDYGENTQLLLSDIKFMNVMCHSLVEKTIYFSALEMNAALGSSEKKVANHILRVAGNTGLFTGNQRMAAETLRMSYRHMHRILKKFVDEGMIERIKSGYRIIDHDRLKNVK